MFSKAAFKRWLRRQPETKVFDYVNNADCVFATFLREELNRKKVNCLDTGFFVGNKTYNIPKWARETMLKARTESVNTRLEGEYPHMTRPLPVPLLRKHFLN